MSDEAPRSFFKGNVNEIFNSPGAAEREETEGEERIQQYDLSWR
jgi:hypothetical protein